MEEVAGDVEQALAEGKMEALEARKERDTGQWFGGTEGLVKD